MDPISLAVGAGILVVGFLAGRISRRGSHRWRTGHGERPICGCSHHRSLHEPKTGLCRGPIRRGNWFDGVRYDDCTCQQYVGPEPITADIWTPPIAAEGSER